MSEVHGKVGKCEIKWLNPPRGHRGQGIVELAGGRRIEVRWVRDEQGIQIEMPGFTGGFDFQGFIQDDGRMFYEVNERCTDHRWHDLHFSRVGAEEALAGSASGKKKGLRIKAQMPGKIVKVLVKVGDSVKRDQPMMVMEAMKMENEIRAPQDAKVLKISVNEGVAVETGAELFNLE